MPTFFRMAEVLFCSMMDFLPYFLLVVYPFRNHIRMKSFLAGLLTLVMTPAVLYYDISTALLGASPVDLPFPLMRSIALLVFGILVIHAGIGKQLLNTLSVINLSILISALADRFAADYTAKHLIVTVVLQAVLLIPYTLNLACILAPTLNESDAPVWKLLFAAPAAGTVIGCMMLLSGASALPVVMIAALVAAAAVAAVTLILTKTEMINLLLKKDRPVKKAAPAAPVAVTAPQHHAADIYLNTLNKRMLDAEHSYKELLLQVMTMEDDLNSDNLEQLRARLNTMRKQLAPEVASSGNTSVDAVLRYHTRQAMISSIKIATNLSLPEVSSVSDEDLTVLISCLLDCALDACREQTAGTRRIAAASYQDGDLLQIGVKNTYAAPADSDSELLNICRDIVSRYDGKLTVLDMNGVTQIVAVMHI